MALIAHTCIAKLKINRVEALVDMQLDDTFNIMDFFDALNLVTWDG